VVATGEQSAWFEYTTARWWYAVMARHLALLLLCVGSATAATVTEGPWTLYRGSSIVQPRVDHKSLAACAAAADKLEPRTYTCRTIANVVVKLGQSSPVPAPAPVPTARITATAASALAGSAIQLTWDCGNAIGATAGGAWSGALAVSGSKSLTPPATGNYSVTCKGALADAVADVLVQVAPAWMRVAEEGGKFACHIACTARYGVDGRWSPARSFAPGTIVQCSTQQFATDPAVGVVKRCEVMPGEAVQ
jgi:hypothetical protein